MESGGEGRKKALPLCPASIQVPGRTLFLPGNGRFFSNPFTQKSLSAPGFLSRLLINTHECVVIITIFL